MSMRSPIFAVLLLLLVRLACYVAVLDTLTDAFVPTTSVLGLRAPLKLRLRTASLRMDTEVYSFDRMSQEALRRRLRVSNPCADPGPQLAGTKMAVREAEARHHMPWKTSIVSSSPKDDPPLLFMPFWEWQLSYLQSELTNLHAVSCNKSQNQRHDYHYNENHSKTARIVNICLRSEEYRKIRMTYYDAGNATQVFNALWYPDPKYNLPVLGIDLLAFNRKKHLAVVDFQPIHPNEDDHAAGYEHLLEPIRETYPALQGRMSQRFYDETRFFSNQMLFARFEDEDIVHDSLMPAFQSYVRAHVDLVRQTSPETSLNEVGRVLQRQKEYDTYSAHRDPAMALFTKMFGRDWSVGYVHDFLFDMSERGGT